MRKPVRVSVWIWSVPVYAHIPLGIAETVVEATFVNPLVGEVSLGCPSVDIVIVNLSVVDEF